MASHHIDRSARQKFLDVFWAKNQVLNLSAIRDEDGIFVKHICDALELQHVERNLNITVLKPWDTVIDVGTWWGIPLLPLAIAYPQVQFTGLDSVRKKTEAVMDMANSMELPNVQVVWSRAEEFKWQYDCLTARAVAFSDILFKRTYTLVKKWGYFILYKMFSEDEEAWIDSYVMQKKMNFISKHYYTLYDGDIQRVIYVIQK